MTADSEMLRQYASALASLSRAEMDIVKYDPPRHHPHARGGG